MIEFTTSYCNQNNALIKKEVKFLKLDFFDNGYLFFPKP